jgi:hypothetical protein
MNSNNPTTDTPSAAFPDEFDRMLGVLDGVSTATVDAIVPVVPIMGVGGTRKFILRTVRHEGRDHLFVEMIGRDRSFREYFPPEVTATIARQRGSLTGKNRRKGAKQAAITRRQSPDYQPPTPPRRRARRKGGAS